MTALAPPDPTALKCLNCGSATLPDAARLFEKVYLCIRCHDHAQRSLQRIQEQLDMLKRVAVEAIREKLIKGELHPGQAPAGTASPVHIELLHNLIQRAK